MRGNPRSLILVTAMPETSLCRTESRSTSRPCGATKPTAAWVRACLQLEIANDPTPPSSGSGKCCAQQAPVDAIARCWPTGQDCRQARRTAAPALLSIGGPGPKQAISNVSRACLRRPATIPAFLTAEWYVREETLRAANLAIVLRRLLKSLSTLDVTTPETANTWLRAAALGIAGPSRGATRARPRRSSAPASSVTRPGPRLPLAQRDAAAGVAAPSPGSRPCHGSIPERK